MMIKNSFICPKNKNIRNHMKCSIPTQRKVKIRIKISQEINQNNLNRRNQDLIINLFLIQMKTMIHKILLLLCWSQAKVGEERVRTDPKVFQLIATQILDLQRIFLEYHMQVMNLTWITNKIWMKTVIAIVCIDPKVNQ